MTPTIQDLQFAAECSCRYHRRRCAFFVRLENLCNWLSLITSSGAFLFLFGGENSNITKYLVAITVIINISQIAFRFGEASKFHESMHADWQLFLASIQKNPNYSQDMFNSWLEKRVGLESRYTNQLKALVLDCRNDTITALGLDEAEMVLIKKWQRPLLHVFDLQNDFPKIRS